MVMECFVSMSVCPSVRLNARVSLVLQGSLTAASAAAVAGLP